MFNLFVNRIIVYNLAGKEKTVSLDETLDTVRLHSAKMDQMGVEPMSEAPSPVLLQA